MSDKYDTPDAIQRDIQRTREGLGRKLDSLQERLGPGEMAGEALGVINSLFIVKQPKPPEVPLDPRLQNLEFVKLGAIRKYIKQCADGEAVLNLDVLSNVIIHANEFVREQRTLAAARRAAVASSTTTTRSRNNAVFSAEACRECGITSPQ